MHIHILGICGTFMGSLALLARDLGYKVTGSDANVYPPMSTQLENAGIEIMQGYSAKHLGEGGNYPTPDLVVVGNAMKRGIEAVEYMLDAGIKYTSGPQFLSEQVLQNRHVLAVAGTHGKTTTTTMLAWVLQYNEIDTGFLIGGVPVVQKAVSKTNERLQNAFAHSSHLGEKFFVIEADEYDSAFFDKRSKFVHYRPRTAILNNLEFDHADIFADLNAIQTQFHHMIRMIPSSGRIIMPSDSQSLEETIAKGCWTPIWRTAVVDEFSTDSGSDANNNAKTEWQVKLLSEDGSHFAVQYIVKEGNDTKGNMQTAEVNWGMSGLHNVNNGLMAIVASVDVGVSVADACEALSNFAGIKRRMELIGEVAGVQVYDDFAHHPTAINTTLDGAKKKLLNATSDANAATGKLWAIIEPRSNTMKMGIHRDSLASSAELADEVLWYEPAGLEWGLSEVIANAVNGAKVENNHTNNQQVLNATDDIIQHICDNVKANDVVVIMSNGGFEGIHGRLVKALQVG